MDENDRPPLSDRSLWQAIADQDAKLDRIAGLGAQTVSHLDRLRRHLEAKDALDARGSAELRGIISEARALYSQLRNPSSFADDRQTGALIRRTRADDTVSLVLHVGGTRIKLSKKRIAFLFSLIGTAVGVAAHWLATLGSK